MSVAAIHKAVYDALIGDSQLVSQLGGVSIYDSPPSDRSFPMVLIGSVLSDEWGTDTDTGLAVTVNLHCWSTNKGRQQVYDIASRISAVLTGGLAADEDSGWNIVLAQPLSTRFERDVSARATKATLRFRILAEPSN